MIDSIDYVYTAQSVEPNAGALAVTCRLMFEDKWTAEELKSAAFKMARDFKLTQQLNFRRPIVYANWLQYLERKKEVKMYTYNNAIKYCQEKFGHGDIKSIFDMIEQEGEAKPLWKLK